MSVRRSSRLKDKEEKAKLEREAWRKKFRRAGERATGEGCSNSSDNYSPSSEGGSSDEEEESLVPVVIDTGKKTTPQRSNDLIRVYHSYNRDHGLDVYEGEFIDDTDVHRKETPSRSKKKPVKRKPLRLKGNDGSSDEDDGGGDKTKRRRVLVVSEDEGDDQNERTASLDRDQVIGVKRRKRIRSAAAQLSTSEEDQEESEEELGEGRRSGERGVTKRKVKFQESDDEIEAISPVKSAMPARSPSVRARKLEHDKKLKSAKLLERLKAQRNSGSKSDEVKEEEVEEGEKYHELLDVFFPEEKGEQQTLISLAERLLFPADNAESSGSEDSDWIVSDGEDSYLDVKELLRDAGDLGGEVLPPYPYPPNMGDEDGDKVLNGGIVLSDLRPLSPSPPPLPLHEAVCSVDVDNGDNREALKDALLQCRKSEQLNATNNQGFTALMCAAERHDSKSVQLLLEAGASVNCRGENGASALHLAALNGCLDCVQLLIAHGHVVDCTDEVGWSPILYAHFKNHEDCVLTLLKANPKQFSILGNILKQSSSHSTAEDSKKKTLKVVRSLLVSLAHNETYYSIFNDFISDHPSILEDEGFHFMKHCMRLLSFHNKQTWFKQKLRVLREHALNNICPPLRLHNIDRSSLLSELCSSLKGRSDLTFWKCPFSVTFRGEAGICTGPRKEFLACLAKSLAKGDGRLFQVCDDNKLSLQACSLFYQYPCHLRQDLLSRHKEMLGLVGKMVAHAVFHNLTPGLHLSLPLLKQLLGQSLDHPSDLEDVDKTLYHILSKDVLEGTSNVEELELTFTQTVCCPWTARTVDVPICEGGRSKKVNEANKCEYVSLLSQFKLEDSIKEELEAFTTGFWKVLPQKCLQIFLPSELTLLISGVPHIDVEDWQKYTEYRDIKESDEVVQWLWRLIRSLKEEEKALLLQFATGSPCLPVGGFSELQGLGGPTPFTVSMLPGKDKIPQASTCFNTLKITEYSCEQQLRNKVLIAIRYGCEGFEFS